MDVTPTRSAVLELREEARALHEGYVFLDEKCLLLAGEMLRELSRHAEARRAFGAAWDKALAALQAAVARHGLDGLQVHPPADLRGAVVRRTTRTLMGVRLQDAEFVAPAVLAPPAVDASPEAEACRRAFRELLARAAPLAGIEGNLERLRHEYRRAVRRARALQDVLMPEVATTVREIETRLEELEQEDAIWMRRERRAGAPAEG
jgi:V/A-type H+-transporting ATPase subunit D